MLRIRPADIIHPKIINRRGQGIDKKRFSLRKLWKLFFSDDNLLIEMNEAVVIFPNQLFDIHPALGKNKKVFLLEETRFFLISNFIRRN